MLPRRSIEIRSTDGTSFEFEPPEELWLDMLAFCEAWGITVEELIAHALEEFFEADKKTP